MVCPSYVDLEAGHVELSSTNGTRDVQSLPCKNECTEAQSDNVALTDNLRANQIIARRDILRDRKSIMTAIIVQNL